MNIVRLINGKVELRKDNGNLLRVIMNSGAVDANINSDGTLIVITTTKGKVELRKDNGNMVRIMSSDAVSARFSGTDIVITTAKGKTEIRHENGNLLRIF